MGALKLLFRSVFHELDHAGDGGVGGGGDAVTSRPVALVPRSVASLTGQSISGPTKCNC